MVTALGKAEKMVVWTPKFLALPSAVTIALGKGVLCRVQQSAKWPKTAIFNFFYIPSWQINSYKHISHIYLIHHIYISSIHTSIRTYHIHHNIYHIYNNKCSSPPHVAWEETASSCGWWSSSSSSCPIPSPPPPPPPAAGVVFGKSSSRTYDGRPPSLFNHMQ